MASKPISIAAPQATERVEQNLYTRTIPMRTIIAVFSALLILFAWLHFVLALQIATINQQIYNESQGLVRHERQNAVILLRIAEAESPQNFEQRAIQGQYKPQNPKYLVVKQILDSNAEDRTLDRDRVPTSAAAVQRMPVEDRALADVLADRLSTWLHIEIRP